METETTILSNPYEFEIMKVYPGLSIIRIKNTDQIVGYVNMNPIAQWWFYFVKDFVSEFYNSEEDATEKLLIHFYSIKLDKIAKNPKTIITS